ncbi:hypothetical protein BC832DRAFT_549583 [Gaertneriomyces semiglobifer]|nr:hypothetical protein BC832DRAFT_549583 [Gaertneriomyces semiglobifer]
MRFLVALSVVLPLFAAMPLVRGVACNLDEDTKAFKGLTAPVVQVASHYPDRPDHKLQISGTVEILDGCNFVVRNFTYFPQYDARVDWFGRWGNNDNAIRVSEPVGASYLQDSPITKLTGDGTGASFHDFDTLVLFSNERRFVLATATFDQLKKKDDDKSPNVDGKGNSTDKSAATSVGRYAGVLAAAAAAGAAAVAL